MNKNLWIIPIIFLITIFSASAVNMVVYSSNQNIYKSLDGTNFTNVYNASGLIGNESITDFCISSDGRYIYSISTRTATPLTSHLIYSQDYGVTWNIKSISYARDISCSLDGQYVYIANGNNTNPATISKSGDYANTFNNISLPTIGFANGLIAISNSEDGSTITTIGSVSGGKIYISTNYGISWNTYNTIVGSYTGICTSYNANRIYATKSSSQIYVNNLSTGYNMWYQLGNTLSSSQTRFACYGEYADMYKQSLYMNLDDTPTINTNNNTYNYIVGSQDITLIYTFNGTQLLYSINDGLTWNNNYNATTNISGIGISPLNAGFNITPLCIDSYTLCNLPVGEYCDVNNTQYCSNGCNNTYIDSVLTGSCNAGLCADECKVYGYKECSSTTSFQVCGNYDTDNCLEYSGDFGCLPNNVCSNGNCISNIGVGLTNNSLFTVTPYSVNTDSTIYTLDSVNRKISIDTKNLIQVQQFAIGTTAVTSYSSRTCDYKETLVDSDVVYRALNSTLGLTYNTIASTGKSELNILPSNLINTTIIYEDSLGQQFTNITLIRNSSAKELCVYNSTGGVIYCSYSVNSYDDLTNVNITMNMEFQSKTYTLTFNLVRQQSTIFSMQPQLFTNNDFNTIIIDTTNATYTNSKLYTYTQPTAFTTTLKNNYDYLPCTYSSNGCRIVRTYNNHNGISDFTNYVDYTVCINSLNNANPSKSNNNGNFLDGGNLSTGTKYLIVLIVIMIIIGVFTGIGFNMNMVQASFITGSIISVFALIMFTVVGWIPAWILVALIIVGIAVTILVSKLPNNSTG